MDHQCIIINARTGNTHANNSQVLELLFRAYTDRTHLHHPRALCVTILYIPHRPGIPSWAPDIVSQSALCAVVVQILTATTAVCAGLASVTLLAILAADTLMEFLVWEFHRYRYTLHRKLGSARIISCGQREALCITKGTNATTAIVVVSEAGAAKLEDLAEGRAQPSPRWAGVRLVAAPIFVLTAYAILAGFASVSPTHGASWGYG